MTGCNICSSVVHYAKGLCQTCYMAKYRTEHREESRAQHARYYAMNKVEQIARSERNRRLAGIQPMGNNRKCSSFLGVHVAERVLHNVFKDVTSMPYGHPGYDFICDRGMKIDVKSSTTRIHKTRADMWVFNIRRNTIADYFTCIAFDNRDDLTPLHMWLIPGHIVNDKTVIAIAVTTVDRWDEYIMPIDKVVTCCNGMKNGGLKEDD